MTLFEIFLEFVELCITVGAELKTPGAQKVGAVVIVAVLLVFLTAGMLQCAS